MNDLVVNINFHVSILYCKPVVEIFTGKIKFLKNKTFSGPLKKIDIINVEICNNLTDYKLNAIKNILHNSLNNQLSKNRYLLNESLFLKLISELDNIKCVYCKFKDNSLNILDGIVHLDQEYFKLENSIFQFSSKVEILDFATFSMIYDKNKLYILGKMNSLGNSIDNVKKSFISMIDIHDAFPNPFFYLQLNKDDNQIVGTLNFQYGNVEINYNRNVELVEFDKYRYFRNKLQEKSYINELYDACWEKSRGNSFIYQNNMPIETSINYLLDKGFTIYTHNLKRFVPSKFINFGLSYNINWFEIDGIVKLNEKEYKLSEMLDFKNKKQRFVEIDEHIIALPHVLLEFKKRLLKRNNKLIAEKKDVGEILGLANELKIKKIDNIDLLIKFDNITLNIPNSLMIMLRDYQVYGVKWLKYLYRNGFGGCLADDMGLGKTIQAIAFLSDRELANSISLVVVPKTLIFNWKRELEKFNKNMKVTIYHGKYRETVLRMVEMHEGIILTTYGTVLNDIEVLKEIVFSSLILDEVQYIKNFKSKTYKAIKRLNSKVTIALSGTPIENNIGELWALMDLLNPDTFGNKTDFVNKYSNMLEEKNDAKNLNLRIQPYILRRTKKQVLFELPDKIEQNIYCEMTTTQKELYDLMVFKIKEEISRLPTRYEIKSNSMILEGLLYLRQICCHPLLLSKQYNVTNCRESGKFEVFKQKIRELVLKKDKVIVFSQFTSMLKIMEKWIMSNRWKYYYLDGQTQHRQGIVDEFEKSDEGIFLISLKAGGVGLNLVSSQYAIIYDPWWNPAVENQAADRIHRIGQKRNAIIYRFITPYSIEERIYELKKIKTDITDSLLDSQNIIKSLSIKDLTNLLE